MSQMSNLNLLLEELADCGNKMIAVANELKNYFSSEPQEAPTETKSEDTPAPTTSYSKEKVRQMLAKKAGDDEGKYKNAVKELVSKYSNGGTFKDVPEEKYSALVAELEVIGDAE